MVLIECTVKTGNITECVELQSIARMCVGGKAYVFTTSSILALSLFCSFLFMLMHFINTDFCSLWNKMDELKRTLITWLGHQYPCILTELETDHIRHSLGGILSGSTLSTRPIFGGESRDGLSLWTDCVIQGIRERSLVLTLCYSKTDI